ncbi:hypothetical protein NKH18_31975 [Streptomyces sp. M10(2022)]
MGKLPGHLRAGRVHYDRRAAEVLHTGPTRRASGASGTGTRPAASAPRTSAGSPRCAPRAVERRYRARPRTAEAARDTQ